MSTFNLGPLNLNDSGSNEEELKQISDYLFMLNEQLRYVLSNLSNEDNFDKGTNDTFIKTAKEIKLTVKKKNLIAEISMQDGVISLIGDRLIVDSTYLKIDEDGTIHATNGEFSGNITASTIGLLN